MPQIRGIILDTADGGMNLRSHRELFLAPSYPMESADDCITSYLPKYIGQVIYFLLALTNFEENHHRVLSWTDYLLFRVITADNSINVASVIFSSIWRSL